MSKQINREKFGKTYHPLREQIVRAIDADPRAFASPNELSKKIEAPLSTVAYHVTELRDNNCIKLAKTEQRRGAVEHYYKLLPGILVEPNLEALTLRSIATLIFSISGKKTETERKIATALREAGYGPKGKGAS